MEKKYLNNFTILKKPKFNPDCKYNKKNKLIRIIKTPTLETNEKNERGCRKRKIKKATRI